MTLSCPFENGSHKEFSIESLETRRNPEETQCLAPLAVGQRAYVMARCPLVRPSVH